MWVTKKGMLRALGRSSRSLGDTVNISPANVQDFLEVLGVSGAVDSESDGRLVLGPWTAEVGYELLYWTPLIEHLVGIGLPPEAIPVSRGGTSGWYPNDLRNNYMELFEIISPTEYRAIGLDRQAHGRGLKSAAQDHWDAILADRLRLDAKIQLLQSRFFEFIRPYVYGRAPLKQLLRMLSFSRISQTSTDLPTIAREALPDRFVALSLYNRPTLNAEGITTTTWEIIKSWSGGLPLIDVSTGLELDDHTSPHLGSNQPRRPLLGSRADRNLAWQTDLVIASSALVATHGGTAYLGLRCGKDVLALQQRKSWIAPNHTAIAQHAARETGGSLSILHT